MPQEETVGFTKAFTKLTLLKTAVLFMPLLAIRWLVLCVAVIWLLPEYARADILLSLGVSLLPMVLAQLISVLIWVELAVAFLIRWAHLPRLLSTEYRPLVLQGLSFALIISFSDTTLLFLTALSPIVFSGSFVTYIGASILVRQRAASFPYPPFVKAMGSISLKHGVTTGVPDESQSTGFQWVCLAGFMIFLSEIVYVWMEWTFGMTIRLGLEPLLNVALCAVVSLVPVVVTSLMVEHSNTLEKHLKHRINWVRSLAYALSFVLLFRMRADYWPFSTTPAWQGFALVALIFAFISAETYAARVVKQEQSEPEPELEGFGARAVWRWIVNPMILCVAGVTLAFFLVLPSYFLAFELIVLSLDFVYSIQVGSVLRVTGLEIPIVMAAFISMDLLFLAVALRRCSPQEMALAEHRQYDLIESLSISGLVTILLVIPIAWAGYGIVLTTFCILFVLESAFLKYVPLSGTRVKTRETKNRRLNLRLTAFVLLAMVTAQVVLRYHSWILLLGVGYATRILIVLLAVDFLVFGCVSAISLRVQDVFHVRTDIPSVATQNSEVAREVVAVLMFLELLRSTVSAPFWLFSGLLIMTVAVVSVARLRLDSRLGSTWRPWKPIRQMSGYIHIRQRVRALRRFLVAVCLSGALLCAWWGSAVVYEATVNGPVNVRVAVVDSGMNTDDPQLRTHVVAQRGFTGDNSTNDEIQGGLHGTLVARLVLESCPRASIINAKALAYTRTPFEEGKFGSTDDIVRAMHWAVEEEKADVINLSLGDGTRSQEQLDAIAWAWSRGVLVVCSAGNSQGDVSWGSSIESPADSRYAIAVGALDSSGNLAGYSSWGPTREPYMKPDIVALGTFGGSEWKRGTSFAAPRVSGAAACIIEYCESAEIEWTPGMLKAALLEGADPLDYPAFKCGSGRLSIEGALGLVRDAPLVNGTPYLCYVSPNKLPLEIDRVLAGSTYTFYVQITCSLATDFSVKQSKGPVGVLRINDSVTVNQTSLIRADFRIPYANKTTAYDVGFSISWRGHNETVEFVVDAEPPRAMIALDLSHSLGTEASIYADYRWYYDFLVSQFIAVTVIDSRPDFIALPGSDFDAVIVLEPWVDENDSFSPQEADVLRFLYESGRGFFFAPAQDGWFQNVTFLNNAINWTGIAYDELSGIFPVGVNASDHAITGGLDHLELSGLLMNCSASSTILFSIGLLESGNALVVCLEGSGRAVIAGTSSFFGSMTSGATPAEQSLTKRITWWLCGLL